MNLIRKIKLARLGIDNLTYPEKQVVRILEHNFELSNIIKFELPVFENTVFYLNSDEYAVLEYNKVYKNLFVKDTILEKIGDYINFENPNELIDLFSFYTKLEINKVMNITSYSTIRIEQSYFENKGK